MLLALVLAGIVAGFEAETLLLDTRASVVHWKGTKFFGLGKHEGIARLNRHDWGVSFRGSRLTNDLVDDAMHFRLDVVLRSQRRIA